MSSGFLDGSQMWRKCEIAWSSWLLQQGWMVIPLGDLNANSVSGGAPLTGIGAGALRTPDILATQGGNTIYWEVKYRTRAHINAMTGHLEHWMSYQSFNDYLRFAEKSNGILKVILYEDPAVSGTARWLEIDVKALHDIGRKESRFSNSGLSIEAWIWPISSMKVVDGPSIEASTADKPLLPEESEGLPMNPAELQPIERRLRKQRANIEVVEGLETRNLNFEKILEEDPVVGLDLLRRSLGVPRIPKYSVLKIGASREEAEEILGLLHYGIRVFLVTNFEIETKMPEMELNAFRESRMLELAVLPDLTEKLGWVVDGFATNALDLNLDILGKAEDAGGINFHQYRVVHASLKENILVTAGAGTGKTETMSERIVFLLSTYSEPGGDENQNPITLSLSEMVLMTFTREAALEIRKRLSSTLILRRRLAGRCVMPTVSWLLDLSMTQIGTIHAYAKKLLQETGTNIGLTPNFRVSNSTIDFRRLIHNALNEGLEALYNSDYKEMIPAAHEWEDFVDQLWGQLSNNGWRISDDEIDWGSGKDEIQNRIVALVSSSLKNLSESFSDFCLRNQLLATNDLVPKALDSISASVGGMKILPRFIFVDEFQDTDSTQMDFILKIQSQSKAKLFVVGDAKQGIYRFRGAEGSAFTELRDRVRDRGYEELIEFPLVRNFRTDGVLLNSLHPIFDQLGKLKLLPYTTADQLLANPSRQDFGTTYTLSVAKGRIERLESVEKRVRSWRESESGKEIALLCRDNWQAVEIRDHLISKDIPCELSIKGNFYQSPVVLEFRILLESLCNPSNYASLLELLETRWSGGIVHGQPPVGLSSAELGYWDSEVTGFLSWRDRFASIVQGQTFDIGDLDILRRRIESLSELSKKRSPIVFLFSLGRTFTPESCTAPNDIPGDDTELRRYRRGWDHLISILDSRFGRTPTTLHGVLDWLRIQIATNTSEDEPITAEDLLGKVTALTVHKAKGLEFGHVLIPYSDKQFAPKKKRKIRASAIRNQTEKAFLWEWSPGDRSPVFTNSDGAPAWRIDDEEAVKEEARLFYVALTRAKFQLEIIVNSDDTTSRVGSLNTWRDFIYLGAEN